MREAPPRSKSIPFWPTQTHRGLKGQTFLIIRKGQETLKNPLEGRKTGTRAGRAERQVHSLGEQKQEKQKHFSKDFVMQNSAV